MGTLPELALALSILALLSSGTVGFVRSAIAVWDRHRAIAQYIETEADLRTSLQQLMERAISVNIYTSHREAVLGVRAPQPSGGQSAALRIVFETESETDAPGTWVSTLRLVQGALRYTNQDQVAWDIISGVSSVSYELAGGVLQMDVTRRGITHSIWIAVR